MIEINLLPGDGKKKRRAKTASATKFEFNLKPPPWLAGLTEKITDKYMLGAVAAAGVAVALIVLMFVSQTARAAMLEARETKAVKDSAQFSAVLNAKGEGGSDAGLALSADRDHQVDRRFALSLVAPDVRDLERAAPVHLADGNHADQLADAAPPSPTPAKRAASSDSTKSPAQRAAERNRAKKARSDSLLASAKDIKFRIVGHTVDIQALTRFMKSLEASPFIQNVQLSRSDLVQAEGKEVTEFTLEAETQAPPPFAIKTVPLVVSAVH